MIDYKNIRSVHLEISTRCNAACPLCPRNSSGYDEDLGYPLTDMTLPQVKKIFNPTFLRQLNSILINGNFGDFVTARDNAEIVEYFVQCNPRIQINISTNGSAGKPELWQRLGKLRNVKIGFALDGLENTHILYRQNTNWQTVINNAKKFISTGGYAIWRMIKFQHNSHQIESCKQISKELGFKRFDLLDHGRDSGPVYDRYGNYSYHLGNKPVSLQPGYPARIELWKEWSVNGSLPETRSIEYKTIPIKQKIECMAKRFSQIYITANGEVYPCCWLGLYPGLKYQHPWQQDNFQVKALIKENNALEVGLEQAILWMSAVEESWNKQSYSDGRLFHCDNYCGH